MSSSSIDALDGKLLALLRAEPRIGVSEAARRLGVARGTVQSRMTRLEERGVISSYGPEVDPVALGYPLLAFVFLQIAQGRLDDAVHVLSDLPCVLEAHATSGSNDLLCRVVARDTQHFQEVVNEILATPAIRRSTSYIALSRQIPLRTAPLVREAAGDGA